MVWMNTIRGDEVDSKDRFSQRVEDYAKYRPGYPEEAVNYLFDIIGLNEESIVAGIGSGTGIFTSLLLNRVKKVYAVEPNREMREAGELLLRGYNGFESIDQPAEYTTLPDKSVDFITVAQAFHWFDRGACKKEFSRILRNDGKVILIWNRRLTDEGFGDDYEKLLKRYAKDYITVNHKNLSEHDFIEFFCNGTYTSVKFSNMQELDFIGLTGRAMSSSYVPLKDENNHDVFIKELRNVFDKYGSEGKVKFRYETEIIWGKV